MEQIFNPLNINLDQYVPLTDFTNLDSDVELLWFYFSKQLEWGESIHAKLTFEFLINARSFSKNRIILDAGAGHQRYREFFLESVYITQEHPEGIKFKGMQNVNYDLISPIDKLIPIKDGSISAVLSTSVIEHIRFPESFLKEAFRVLSPGGRIYIHVPFSYAEHEKPFDFNRPTSFGLKAWLEDAGFEKIFVMPSSSNVYSSSFWCSQAVRSIPLKKENKTLFNIYYWIFETILKKINKLAEDHIDMSTEMPIGWIAIAEKAGNLPSNDPLKYEILLDI